MKLFPPYKTEIIAVNDLAGFMEYLKQNTEVNHTNHKATLKGKITEHGFILEPKLNTVNSCRPQIFGSIIEKNDKTTLKLHVGVKNQTFSLLIILLLIPLVIGLIKGSIYTLLNVTLIAVVLYGINWILYASDLKKTLSLKKQIINNAANSAYTTPS